MSYTANVLDAITKENDGTGPLLSLIVPCYNEAPNIQAFYDATNACFSQQDFSYEMVFVDDGSSDETFSLLSALADSQDCIQAIRFSRNFGKEAALLAGLNAARGQFLCFIDADLQQRPQTALEMFDFLRANNEYDCVAAYQAKRKESSLLKFCKRGFYRIFNVAGDTDIPADASDFRVFRRCVGDALRSMPEYYRFSKGLFAWVGFSTYAFPYEPDARNQGSSKWSFWKLFKYAMGGIVSFTTWPLKVAIVLGTVAAVAALVYLVVVIVEYVSMGIAVPGYPTLVCLVLFLGGAQLLVLGVIGEYLARVYVEGHHRPLYVEKEHRYSRDMVDLSPRTK